MIKQKVNMKSIKSIISVVVSLMMLIAATIAWFVLQSRASIDGLDAGAAKEEFVVSKEKNGTQIEVGDDSLSFTMDDFVNVADQKMAPGTSGKFDLWVRTSSNAVTKFIIRLDNSEMKFDDGEAGGGSGNGGTTGAGGESEAGGGAGTGGTTEAGGEASGESGAGGTTQTGGEPEAGEEAGFQTDSYDYSAMLRNHIKFYQDKDYTKELTYDNPVTGSLTPNTPVQVTIYWKWMYDGEEYLVNYQSAKGKVSNDSFVTFTKQGINNFKNGEGGEQFFVNKLNNLKNLLETIDANQQGDEPSEAYTEMKWIVDEFQIAKEKKTILEESGNENVLNSIDYFLSKWDEDDNYISKHRNELMRQIHFEAYGATDDYVDSNN